MTTSVTDDRQAFEAWMKTREGFPFAGTYANLMWVSWQAALRSQGKVVKACDLRALPRYEVSNDGFTSTGTPTVERDDQYGDWIKYEDLTAIIGEGD